MEEDPKIMAARMAALERQLNLMNAALEAKEAEIAQLHTENNAALEAKEAEIAQLHVEKAELKADVGRKELINKMEGFVGDNQSTSTEARSNVASSHVGLHYDAGMESLLGSIACLEPMNESEWKRLRNKINKIAFSDTSEREGVHPRLQELFSSLLASLPEHSRHYVIRYEKPMEDSKALTTIPDFSVLIASSMLSVESGTDSVFNIEAKKHSMREKTILQALGYLCHKLIDCIDLVSGEGKLFGFCVGVDGDVMWLGRIDVDLASNDVTFRHTPPLPLWEINAEVETIGCRLIRTLLSCSPDALGHGPWTTLTEQSKNFQLVSVLGRGGFSVVFKAELIKEDGSKDYVVLKKLKKPVSNNTEIELLKKFSGCGNLPTLCFQEWSSPILLPTQPMGVPLLHYARKLPATQRQSAGFSKTLLKDLRTAAQHALIKAGVCHRDIRPQNVVVLHGVDDEKFRFILIDWGLAAPEGDPMHKCLGGLAYFDDKIVEHYLQNNTEPLPFESKYDLSSMLYVACATARADNVEWVNFRETLLSERKKYFQEWKNKLDFATLNRMLH